MNSTKTTINSFLTALICAFLLVSNALASDFHSEKEVLDNGLTVLLSEIPTSPMVCVYGLIKTGSAREGKYTGSGISHYLEHMLFKGTHGRDVGEIAARIQAVGGSMNGSTSLDFTIYTINVPAEHFDLALEVLADMLFEATIDPQETEKEREVIYAEMRLNKDNPDRQISRLTFQNVYQKHPYRHPVIGYRDLLANISREDLWAYYKQNYAVNNMILSVAGNMDITDVKEKIKSKLGALPREAYVLDLVPQEPAQLNERRYEQQYATQFARLSLAFRGVSLMEKDLYPLDVLAQILGQGQSSRAHQRLLKEKNLVYSVRASNFTPIDQGVFEIEAMLDDENVMEVENEMLKLIKQIKLKGVTTAELKKAKRQVLSNYIKGNQKASSVAWRRALDEAFAGDYLFSEKYVEQVKGVNAGDIKRVSKQYLNNDNLSVTVLRPQKEKAKETVKKSLKQGEIKRHVLENGLTVLLREDPSFPVVAVNLVLKGGLLAEPKDLNGISDLMSGVWIQGTKKLSSKDIEEQTEERGIDLGSYSGRNSFGINMSLLKEDSDFALGILHQIITEPEFPDNEIEIRKKNMLSALARRNDNIFPLTGYRLSKELFGPHPYGRETIGTKESLGKIKREDLINFHSDYVAPNNMVLSVFGDINSEEMLTSIKQRFSKLERKEITFKSHEPAKIDQSKEVTQQLNKEQAMISVGFLGIDIFDPDRHGIEVLESILGSSFSGRLFNSVREELGKAYTMGGVSMPGLEIGQIYFYVLTDKDAIATVKKIIEKEIKKLQTTQVPAEELNDIKTYLKGNFQAGLETNSNLSFTSSLDELYGLGFDAFKAYSEKIDKVTQSDIQNLANKYLDLSRSVTIITQPD